MLLLNSATWLGSYKYNQQESKELLQERSIRGSPTLRLDAAPSPRRCAGPGITQAQGQGCPSSGNLHLRPRLEKPEYAAYIYIHIHIKINTYTSIHMYIDILPLSDSICVLYLSYVCIYIHSYVFMHILILISVCTFAYSDTCVYLHLPICEPMLTFTFMFMLILTCIYAPN